MRFSIRWCPPHAAEYVRENVHTGGLENFWSLLQRYRDLTPTDQTAKGPELVERLKADLAARFPATVIMPATN